MKKQHVKLSTKEKDLNPNKNTQFHVQDVSVAELEHVFKSTNYSAIVWNQGIRAQDNFLSATGFIVDIDGTETIDSAVAHLKELGINHALITSKSHKKESHRFHIYIPFNRVVLTQEDYVRISREITEQVFPKSDKSVVDAARFLFGSPEDAVYTAYWDGKEYDVDGGRETVPASWNAGLVVQTSDGEKIEAVLVKKKTAIYCPFHIDENASAFICPNPAEGTHFIHCSACSKTFWLLQEEPDLKKMCANYWSYGTDIIEMGILGEKFFHEKNSEKKVYARTNCIDDADRTRVYNYLAKEKHIPHLDKVNYRGDIEADKSCYKYSAEKAAIDVCYS